MAYHTLSYGQRAHAHPNALSKRLLELMESKKTNLCVAADVTSKHDLLRIADAAGPSICILKLHIDILADYDDSVPARLRELADKHGFLVFEDRKFADIGNTARMQYAGGVYRIAGWADLVTAHAVPGPGGLAGLAEGVGGACRGCLLLAEMSSAGTLARDAYTADAVRMALARPDFVVGFIAMQRYDGIVDASETRVDFLYMTPGVAMAAGGDAMGQQYKTPHNVIAERGCDVIIVGRGVYAHGDGKGGVADLDTIRTRVQAFRKAGWDAYLERIAAA
ncbi:orotidine-5'-phosphate decarboxylase [Synchytrium endobioticum]|uniref:Orotidine 5'-phosphate decarboxylase n=1 Tax=Synchytrium endobioticum TaxID=286115 RepID=A0A507CWC7_9FUNG|nr:orotidine-5'-phosphate decarboxylase [Synchytrium endobioticum]